MIDKKSFEWLKTTPHGIGSNVVEAEMALCEKRESRRIEREGKRLDERRPYKTTIAEMIGRSKHAGTLTECGRFLEVFLSVEPLFMGAGQANSKLSRPRSKEEEQESQESIAARVNHRARKRIRRLVNANDFRDMVSLTLAPPGDWNELHYKTTPYAQQRDYDVVRGIFHDYIKRLRRKGLRFPYLVVFEQHNSEKTKPEKRGCWHIHIALKEDEDIIQEIMAEWWHGTKDHQDFRYDKKGNERAEEVQNPGAYMAEYIGKNGEQFQDARMVGKRRYTTSRNIIKPVQRRIEDCDIDGAFDCITYNGNEYSQEFYTSKHIPGTQKYAVSVTYMRREGSRYE